MDKLSAIIDDDLSSHGGVMLPDHRVANPIVLLLATVVCAHAADTKLHGWCVPVVQGNGEVIQCQLRSDDGAALSDATATSASRRRLKAAVDSYGSDKYISAWYFLVQQSGVTTAQLEKMSNAVAVLAGFEGKQCYALATYTDALLQRTQFGAFKSQLQNSLRDIRETAPPKQAPALYKAARDAIARLDAVKADRKALVLLSNGSNEDESVAERSVVDLARSKNIVVYGLFFGDMTVGRPERVTRLAEKTYGVSRDFSDQSGNDISSFAAKFSQLLENGMVLRLPARDFPEHAELTMSARLADNRVLTTPPVSVHRVTQDTILDRIRRLLLENLDNVSMLVAAAALVLGLLLIRASLRGRARTSALAAAAPEGAATPIAVPEIGAEQEESMPAEGPISVAEKVDGHVPDTIYGWLQFLDATSTRIPVAATSLRIGRHPDNDVCLPNKSVHRQHAVLHKTSNGAFVIRDLDTKNGVIVNGKRCRQHSLADNDLIELGEVRLRFVVNKDLNKEEAH